MSALSAGTDAGAARLRAAPDYYAAGAQDPGRGQHYPLVPLARCPSPRRTGILRQVLDSRKLSGHGRFVSGHSRTCSRRCRFGFRFVIEPVNMRKTGLRESRARWPRMAQSAWSFPR